MDVSLVGFKASVFRHLRKPWPKFQVRLVSVNLSSAERTYVQVEFPFGMPIGAKKNSLPPASRSHAAIAFADVREEVGRRLPKFSPPYLLEETP
jgi:hypothetical protein